MPGYRTNYWESLGPVSRPCHSSFRLLQGCAELPGRLKKPTTPDVNQISASRLYPKTANVDSAQLDQRNANGSRTTAHTLRWCPPSMRKSPTNGKRSLADRRVPHARCATNAQRVTPAATPAVMVRLRQKDKRLAATDRPACRQIHVNSYAISGTGRWRCARALRKRLRA